MKTEAVKDNQVITTAYVDQFRQENDWSRRVLAVDFCKEPIDLVTNNQDNDFNDKKLTNIDSKTFNRNASSHNAVANKKYFNVELDKNII